MTRIAFQIQYKTKVRPYTKDDWNKLWKYIFYTFAIAWGSEFLLIAIYHFGLLNGVILQILHYMIIGFGAGMAPAYAAFIIEKQKNAITFKHFCKEIFYTFDYCKTIFFLILFALIQFGACIVQETYLGNSWYMFLLFLPLMILGGGLEEIGWRGIFQPLLEKRFHFLVATVIEGAIWSIWHLPLWLVPNSSQSSMNFIAFTLYCITLGLTLAAVYRLTKSIWVTVLIHAWGNTVLGGMYTLTSLNNLPDIKTLVVYSIQAVIIILILICHKSFFNFYDNNFDKPTLTN